MSWRTVKLGDVCVVRRGTTITEKTSVKGVVPVVAGGVGYAYKHNIANREANVITVSGSGANAGYVNFWNEPIFASDCSTVESKSDEVLIEYVYFYLKSKQKYINDTMRSGAAQPHVYAKDIANIEMLLPSMEEQNKTIDVIRKAISIQNKCSQSIKRLTELSNSIFFDMFVDGKVDKNKWIEATVDFCAEAEKGSMRTGPFGSDLLHSEFTDTGVAVLGIDNAVNNYFSWSELRYISFEKYEQLKRYTVKAGDVLITIMGTCGRCAVVPDDIGLAINTKHLCCVTLDQTKCLPAFLHSYFLLHPTSQKYLQQTAKGAIMSGLNMGIIKAMPILLPPVELQAQYNYLIKKINTQRVKQTIMLSECQALLESISSKAFTAGFNA